MKRRQKSQTDPSQKHKRSKGLVTKPRSTSKAVVPSQLDPLLAAYLSEVKKYPLLTKEEEYALALHYYEHKDRESLQRLVTSNLRFVIKIAFEYTRYRGRVLDLVQEGNMGLVKAVQEFNPYKGVRLTTYAVWWIRSYIQESILKNHSLVKIGTTQAQKRLFYRLRSEQKKLEQMGISPVAQTKLLASHFDVKEKDVREMDQRLSGGDVSLHATPNDATNSLPIYSVRDPSMPIDESLGKAEQAELFHHILGKFKKTLEGREEMIFSERLISETPLTLQEIGDRYGVTKERARQIEEQVKQKLRTFVSEHYPDYELLVPNT